MAKLLYRHFLSLLIGSVAFVPGSAQASFNYDFIKLSSLDVLLSGWWLGYCAALFIISFILILRITAFRKGVSRTITIKMFFWALSIVFSIFVTSVVMLISMLLFWMQSW